MLVVRSEQMDVLSDYMLGEFERRMLEHLRRAYPEETSAQSEEDLAEQIADGISIAERYRVTDENDVERFLETQVRLGRRFYEQEWAAAILATSDRSGTRRMDEIDDYELFVLAEGVGGGRD